ncbi:MAG: hypothetical protein KDG51_18660, partial [Calditrichaeota bacterium]|nr:hypothetical protein [Calditrichota bacterium]
WLRVPRLAFPTAVRMLLTMYASFFMRLSPAIVKRSNAKKFVNDAGYWMLDKNIQHPTSKKQHK